MKYILPALAALAALLWAVGTLYGLALWGAGVPVAIVVALFTLAGLMALLFGMIYFVQNRCHHVALARWGHKVCLTLYVALSAATALPVVHFAGVASQRADIESEGNGVLQYITDAYTPDFTTSYTAWVGEQLDSLDLSLKAQGETESTIETRRTERWAELTQKSGYDDLEKQFAADSKQWSADLEANIFHCLTLTEALREIDAAVPHYLDPLKEQGYPHCGDTPESLAERVTTFQFSLFGLVAIALLQLMLLLVYLKARPSEQGVKKYGKEWATAGLGKQPDEPKEPEEEEEEERIEV